LLPWDAITLKEAAGSKDDLSLVNPYAFQAPLAPETAAELEHVQVDSRGWIAFSNSWHVHTTSCSWKRPVAYSCR